MTKGSWMEVIVLGLGSLFCLWGFSKLWLIRLSGEVTDEKRKFIRQHSGTWYFLYVGLGFAVEAAKEYHPLPSDIKNPYYWSFGIIGLVAACHHVWSERRAARSKG